ncbi:MAG: hypothetical protein NXY57DRAFT_962662 [Lentinula lateritia]|uniref:Uncharacterized protein n=1 Tax=Lentinula lateritia TaxID=40482 RepID=A0ABQ8VY17_9AGAR|nr:uncharacterized protein C8R40DRAFT_1171916 [Lentinula edodes]KAH7873989.1 hypothetical protein C8R40DRAFT_1171916 [Lentinula edodes]KAJ3930460.1 MAG: hypothetical protein NXY57DRAFT_962662 [Lentinula lateritia]KAJ4501226.1 hypothetical protein C8R41DRAFT_913218 [Lentinula lateritia]
MGRGRATPTSKSARRSVARAPSASYARRHPMITRSKTVQVATRVISDPTPLSAPNATDVDSAIAFNADVINVSPPLDTISPTPLSIADPISSDDPTHHPLTDEDDRDDEFHDEVRMYLDYSSDILRAQAEEVKLLRREVASAREEKAVLKNKHAADVAAREEEYRCPICYELLWDPYV